MRNIFLAIIVLLIAPTVSSAQNNECSGVREEALTTAAKSCINLGSNEACLGHAGVESVINCDTDLEFAVPGDTIPLQTVCAMRLGAMQPSGQWGIAVMKIPTNSANQSITFVLLGDIEIQNAASASSQLRVWIKSDTEIHSGPGLPYSSLGVVAAGEVIYVNACNCTRHWLRMVLDDGRVGWIPARNVSVLGDAEALPIVKTDAPIYETMQAFNFSSGREESVCAEAAMAGILIQASSGPAEAHLQINGVEIALTSTIFVRSQPGGHLTIDMLDGVGRVTTNDFTAVVPAGARAVIPLSDDNVPNGLTWVEPYAEQDVTSLPIALLPVSINPIAALNSETPQIVGIEQCTVLSDRGETVCPLHFVNLDGDAITRMEVEFVAAPQGEWTGSVVELPEVIHGDSISGKLAWKAACSLGSANFIGPVKWSIIITDEMGHSSQPYEASFNCVDG